MLKISDAATLALHTAVVLASRPNGPVSTKEVASRLKASEAHLSKVLQRLAKVGLVKSIRGPNGGFVLGKPPSEITLLNVYEAIDGPLVSTECLLGSQVCEGKCILGSLLGPLDKQVRDHLAGAKLSELVTVHGG